MPSEVAGSVQYYIDRAVELEDIKKPWLPHFQSLAEIYLTRKMDFTRMIVPGQFLQADVFDNTGQFSAYLMASVFLSMMWPDSSRTFTLEPVRRLKGLPGVEEYFKFATEEMYSAMDNPKAGLSLALMEYFLDQGIFGTSGVAVLDGPEDSLTNPVLYDAWSIKTMTIAENAQGFVDTVYYKRELTVRQIMIEYANSPDLISPKVKEQFANGKPDEKVTVLYVIEPKSPTKGMKGVAAMSVRTLHIDVTNRFQMREGGYHEMPIFVGRMFKSLDEPYGRSSGMLGLPDAESLNVLSEAILVASEKQLDPPLGVLDDGRLGGGVIDTSAGALNVFNSAGRMSNEKPIFPLFTVGEMQSAAEQKKELKGAVAQAFFLDRLLDLNNQTQMTAYETSVRNQMRGEALGAIFSRHEKEVLTPLVQRTFNILWRRGQLGVVKTGIGARIMAAWDKIVGADKLVVPAAVLQAAAQGLDVFEVKYISPAKRFMQAEKLQGIFTATDAIVALAPVLPGITDNLNPDTLAHDIFTYSGAPKNSLRTSDDVLKFRAANAQKQAQADKLAAAEQASKIGLNSANSRAALGTVKGA